MPDRRFRVLMLLACLFLLAFPALAQDALPLTQHFATEDNLIAFDFPADWAISDNHPTSAFSLVINVSPSEDTLSKDFISDNKLAFAPGEIRVNLVVFSTAKVATLLKLDADVSTADIVDGLFKRTGTGSTVFGDVSEVTLGDHTGAAAPFRAAERGDGLVVLLDLGGGMTGGAAVYAAPDELPGWQATIEAIVTSLTYGAPPTTTAAPITLSQTYTSPDETLTLNYPDGWQTDTNVGAGLLKVSFASADTPLTKDIMLNLSSMKPGEATLHLYAGSPAALIGELAGIEATDDPVTFLASFLAGINQIAPRQLSDATALTINDLPAARIDIDGGKGGQGIAVVVRLEANRVALIVFSTGAGELADWESTLQAMLDSLAYQPLGEAAPPPALDLTQHFVSSDSVFSFDYPADWQIDVADSTASTLDISLASTGSALHKDPLTRSTDRLAPDQARILINSGKKADLMRAIGVSADAALTDILSVLLQHLPNSDAQLGAAEAITVGGYTAARMTFSIPNLADGYIVLIDFGNGIMAMPVVYYAPGEQARWDATIAAVLDSITYSA